MKGCEKKYNERKGKREETRQNLKDTFHSNLKLDGKNITEKKGGKRRITSPATDGRVELAD